MRTIPYYILDVFTDVQLGGNPLAVFPDSSNLREDELQKIAAETNLSETVFIQEPTDKKAVKKLRIFTPKAELPLAGHPVVGTWFLLADTKLINFDGLIKNGMAQLDTSDPAVEKITFLHELQVGTLPVAMYRSGGNVQSVVMDQDVPWFGDEVQDLEKIARAISLESRAIADTGYLPRPVSTGNKQLVIPVATAEDLKNAFPDTSVFLDIARELDVIGFYLFTQDLVKGDDNADVETRGFYPTLGIIEDPATGSGAGCLGAYMAWVGILGQKASTGFRIRQGTYLDRPSSIDVRVTATCEDITGVQVGGKAVIIAKAEMYLP